jgi:predicted enzyme related to lactoylglutathione lyase
MKQRVKALGGIFFKSQDPSKLKKWYADHLGIDAGDWGAKFEWRWSDAPDKTGTTAWSIMKAESPYFDPSKQQFMINYIVEDLDALLTAFKSEGIEVLDQQESSDFGKFAWIMDPEGQKIELWEPAKKD